MRRRKCRDKIEITPQLVETCFRWDTCGCGACGGIPDVQLDGFVFRIRRLGTKEFCVEYDAWSAEERGLCFLWDSAIYDLPRGRYEGVLFYEDEECMCVEIDIVKNVSVLASGATHKEEPLDV